ncbi:MAG: c-type cytochrome biogenesis protein CcmI [Alphaproteobacteria bacterium]
MIFWIVATAVTLVVIGLIARPFLSQRLRSSDSADYDVEVYKSQLSELDRERAEGLIGDKEADAARTEIARRLLAADSRRGSVRSMAGKSTMAAVAAILAIATPGAAVALYFFVLGSPGLQDHPYSARTAEIEQNREAANPGSLEAMADRVAERIEKNGGTLDDWVMLARTNMTLQRFGEAAAAFSEAALLAPDSAQMKSSYGEALVFGSQGSISEQAEIAFQQALALDPLDPRARFYLAEGQWQKGYREDALNQWIDMAANAPSGATWLPTVRERALAAADELGIDIADRLPEPVDMAEMEALGGPTAEDIEAAQNMSDEERQEMIKGMVRNLADQLEANPMDFQGWQRLIRSRVVLGDIEAAQTDLDRALTVFENAPFPRRQLVDLAQELDLNADVSAAPGPTAEDIEAAQEMSEEDQQTMIRGMVDGLADRLRDEPMDFQGWLRLVRSRVVLGETEQAQADLNQALQIFADAPFPKQRLIDLAQELGLNTDAASTRGPTAEDIEAAQDMSEEDQQAMIMGMVEGLASRLEDEPNDLNGWLQLAQSYSVLGMPEESLNALLKAGKVFPENTNILLLEARVRRSIANASVTPATTALMQRVLKQDPQNVEALWFMAVQALEDGDRETARQTFNKAIDALPEGSDERPALAAERDRILQVTE